MVGSEKEKKMELMHRAVGQIEGVAFFQSEVVRDLLMMAVEDITDGVESMKEQMENMEEVGLMQTTQIERLMKDKDDLLTENAKLREAGERIAASAAPPADAQKKWRRQTPPEDVGSRNDEGGVPAGDPSGGFAATSPCAGEALGAEDGCEYCRNKKPLVTDGMTTFFIDRAGWLSCRVSDRTKLLAELKFCPKCGREL